MAQMTPDDNIEKELTQQELLFIDNYMSGLYIYVAYEKAGYDSDRHNASRKFRDSRIQAEIKRRQELIKKEAIDIMAQDLADAVRRHKSKADMATPEGYKANRDILVAGGVISDKQQIEHSGEVGLNLGDIIAQARKAK
jgi:phage terminase small subunit